MPDFRPVVFRRIFVSSLRLLLLLSGLSMVSFSVNAQQCAEGKTCVCAPSELQFQSPAMQPGENGKYPISLEADNVEAQGEDLVTLKGNAEVAQGRQTIVADELQYYRATDRVVATGNVEMITENGNYLAAESLDVHAPSQIGTVTNADFKMARSLTRSEGIDTVKIEARGSADVVNLEGEGVATLEGVTYTNCQEGKDHVLIRAANLELDQNSGVGKARNATVRFMGVPIFYTPYLSFPLNDERKTGFLIPGFGSDEESGNVLEVPWYWNIAKEQDATFTPRYYTDRGFQLGAEYRRQTLNSQTYLYGEYLPGDELYDDEDRDMVSLQHYQQITPNLTGQINYNDVSDVDYFDDFRDNARYFSATYVPRDATLSYTSRFVNVYARASEYEIIDPDIPERSKPYERLPSVGVSANLPEGPWGMRFGLSGSYTNFASDFRIEGQRTSLNGSAELPFQSIWGYLTPKVSLYHRSYDLDNVSEGAEDSPSFSVPIFSLDTGIYLEKNINWFGEGALQTLEPRLFYVYAPNEDQDDVPVFDTSQVSLNNFSNIFRENRFYGEDRVGDTNQVTIGLTTRVIDNKSGDQRLKASIGQLYLVDDLEQNLFSSAPIESGLGDLLGEVYSESEGGFTTYGFLQYDHDESEIRTARFAVGYNPKKDQRKKFSLGYYYARGFFSDVDQVTLGFSWPLSARWQVFGDERYSIEDSESISTTLGLEYNGCCWKFRITGQERLHNRDIEDKKTAVFFQLELTSLGRVRTGF